MYKRITISCADQYLAEQMAYHILMMYPTENYKVIKPSAFSIWGLDPNERVILAGVGPAESLIYHPSKDPELRLNAYKNLSHTIFIPYRGKFKEWSDTVILDAKLRVALQYLTTFGSKFIPAYIHQKPSFFEADSEIRAFIADIQLVTHNKTI